MYFFYVEHFTVSVVFGLIIIGCSYYVDSLKLPQVFLFLCCHIIFCILNSDTIDLCYWILSYDFAFWGYLFGVFAFWGGLSSLYDYSYLYCCYYNCYLHSSLVIMWLSTKLVHSICLLVGKCIINDALSTTSKKCLFGVWWSGYYLCSCRYKNRKICWQVTATILLYYSSSSNNNNSNEILFCRFLIYWSYLGTKCIYFYYIWKYFNWYITTTITVTIVSYLYFNNFLMRSWISILQLKQ